MVLVLAFSAQQDTLFLDSSIFSSSISFVFEKKVCIFIHSISLNDFASCFCKYTSLFFFPSSSTGCGSGGGGGVFASCHKTSFQRGLMIVREVSWGREGLGFMLGMRDC